MIIIICLSSHEVLTIYKSLTIKLSLYTNQNRANTFCFYCVSQSSTEYDDLFMIRFDSFPAEEYRLLSCLPACS